MTYTVSWFVSYSWNKLTMSEIDILGYWHQCLIVDDTLKFKSLHVFFFMALCNKKYHVKEPLPVTT